ncbi:hypothetical protein BG015_001216, partial [Linnemannia schmuckeri]
MSAPPRSSTPTTTLLILRSASILVATTLFSMTTTASAESGAFELQTNLVSCGGNNSATNNAGGSTAPIAVCAPPESKLFNNVRVVNGTPQPGSTGVRGRLYDVGNLCTEKVSDKIDRAWIAFLDCSGGCSLATKLANLQGSNPQAVLIYNQAACTVNAPPAAPAGGSPMPAVPTFVASPAPAASPVTAPVASPAPAAAPVAAPVTTDAPVAVPATTDAPVAAPATPTPEAPPAAATSTASVPAPAAPTQPTESNPNGGDKGGAGAGEGEDSNDDGGGDRNDDGDGDRNDIDGDDDGEWEGGDDGEDNGDNDNNNDDSNDGDNDDGEDDNSDDDDEGELARKHPRSFQTKSNISGRNNNIISLEGLVGAPGEEGQESDDSLPQGRSPHPRPIPHPINAKRSAETAQGRSPRPRPTPHSHVSETMKRSIPNAKRSSTEPQGRSPRPHPNPHSHIVGARRAAPASPSDIDSHQQQQHNAVRVMGIADAYVQFPITVAMAEQVTTDYLLKVLTGPAASSPLPAPLKALKTTVNPNGAASSSINPTAAADSNNGVITDLMVSISPAFEEPTGERKFLSMSKPIFATVVGILSAVVCGVVLLYVVRPLVRRHRRQRGSDGGGGGSTALVGDSESESRGTPPSQSSGGNGYFGNSTAYTGDNINSSGCSDGKYDDYSQHASKEAPYSASSTATTDPITHPPPMQEVYSEKTHAHHQKKDSNSAPTTFDHSLSGNNTPYPATVPFAAGLATSLNAVEPEDPKYAQKHLRLLRNQDHLHRQPQSVPLPDSTVATPTTATVPAPPVQLKEIHSARTRSNWGSGYTPTTPTVYSISTPTSTTATVATATPTTAELPSGSTSVFENIRAAGALSHHVDVIPEESYRKFLEPAAPQDYTHPTSTSGLTFATSGHRNDNDNADDDEVDRYPVVNSRNGSDLFHSEIKPRHFPTAIDTSTFSTTTTAYGTPSSTTTTAYGTPSSSLASGGITREGGLATALYRNRYLSMDNPGGFSPAAQSPFSSLNLSLHPRGNLGTDSNSNTPRASLSNDFLPTRVSMDSPLASYRDSNKSIGLQTRFQDLMSSNRASSAPRSSLDGGTPRASFSDDYRPRLPTIPSSSRLTNITTSNTGEIAPRAPISNNSSRIGMDSLHRSSTMNLGDIQTRFHGIASYSSGRLESAPASAATKTSFSESTAGASFSEDFSS